MIGPSSTATSEVNETPLPPIEELLCDVEDTHESQYTATTVEHSSEGADGAFELPTPSDCEDPPAPGRERDGDMRERIISHSSVHLLNNGSTFDEQGGLQGAISTPAISVLGTHAG